MGAASRIFFIKAALCMGLIMLLSGVFGCSCSPACTKQKHSISDISMLSMACSHMCYSYGYSFSLERVGDDWSFEAHCFVQDHEVETEISCATVSNEDIKELFDILNENDIIAYVESYKKPKSPKFFICDETKHYFAVSFSDGSQYSTDSAFQGRSELEKFFYSLAEKLS